MTNDPSAVKAFRGMEALADTRMEFIEWLCEKHNLDFAEQEKQESAEYGAAVHFAFWGFHLDEHEHGTHCKGI